MRTHLELAVSELCLRREIGHADNFYPLAVLPSAAAGPIVGIGFVLAAGLDDKKAAAAGGVFRLIVL